MEYIRRIHKPGLYLDLYHGYSSHEERNEASGDWGEQGPIIGPLEHVQITYATHIKFCFVSDEDAKLFAGLEVRNGTQSDLTMDEDCIIYGDMLYGDMVVYYVPHGDPVLRPYPIGAEVEAVRDLTTSDLDPLAVESGEWGKDDVLVEKGTRGSIIAGDADDWAVQFKGPNIYFDQIWHVEPDMIKEIDVKEEN